MSAHHGGAAGLPRSFFAACLLLSFVLAAASSGRPARASADIQTIPYADARPIIEATARGDLPAPLREGSDRDREARWRGWVDARNREIRDRLAPGDEDTIVLWMALGTSFTRERRVIDLVSAGVDQDQLTAAVRQRAQDFVTELAAPRGTDERLAFAREVVHARGLRLDTAAGRGETAQFLIARFVTLLRGQRQYAQQLQTLRERNDPSAEFVARSTLFSDRGLSLDTSFPPNLGIEEALAEIGRRYPFGTARIRRAAVIGPGLDFADKDTGFDFYPPQTFQPFALAETLLRLGLADREALTVVTLDLSPRVNQHLARARDRARQGTEYILHLPLDDRAWKPGAIQFWERFGSMIGRPLAAAPRSGLPVRVRSVAINPAIVTRIDSSDVNIVLERSTGAPFDLIVATNIFVYYGVFEQALALANVKAMLRPGGLLLSNTALPELPGSNMRSIGYSTTEYSARPGDGDHVVWYRRTEGGTSLGVRSLLLASRKPKFP